MDDNFWTFDAVEERLVEAVRLWWRSPGGGTWPFAGDAPWQLMTRRTRISTGGLKGRELQLHMQEEDAEETRRWQGRERIGPLSRADIARRDEASEWLTWIAEDSRKVVTAALWQLAAKAGRGSASRWNDGRREHQVSWIKVRASLGEGIGTKGLYRRYARAIATVCARLNRSAA